MTTHAGRAHPPPAILRALDRGLRKVGRQVAPFPQLEPHPAFPIPARRRLRHRLLESRGWTIARGYAADFDDDVVEIIRRVTPFTLTSPERLAAVIAAVDHILSNELDGAFVEAGVWRGGSMMAAALRLQQSGSATRDLYLLDTYAGMTKPGELDAPIGGSAAEAQATWAATREGEGSAWGCATLDEVERNMRSTGYPASRMHFVKGPVEETVPGELDCDELALLRLDTDWYESTAHELQHLYPRLCRGGLLIVDDYGHWSGARRAVDEYFAEDPTFINRIDYTGRLLVKR